MHMNAHDSFIRTAQNQKRPKYPSASEWINHSTYMHTTGTPLSHKKEQIIDICNVDESQKSLHCVKRVIEERKHTMCSYLHKIVKSANH